MSSFDKIMICMNLSHTDQVWKYKIYLKIKEAHVNVLLNTVLYFYSLFFIYYD